MCHSSIFNFAKNVPSKFNRVSFKSNKLALIHGTEKSYPHSNGWMGARENKIK